jgi:NAD(P)H-hydrate epimerase
MKLVTVSQMQAIEKEADASGLTYDQMMENAGQGLADIILSLHIGDAESEVIGLVGPGNNGGDTRRNVRAGGRRLEGARIS